MLDYIGLSDQVKRMEDVVIFVKSLTPSITRVGKEVRSRGDELTSQVHRDLLIGALERAINTGRVQKTELGICGQKMLFKNDLK